MTLSTEIKRKSCRNCKHNNGDRHKSTCAIGKNQNPNNKPYYMVLWRRCAVVEQG